MKQLTFAYSYMTHSVIIDDEAKAQEAYASIKTAMAEYREYGNDKENTVEIDLGDSGIKTIRIGEIASVSLTDLDAVESTAIKHAVWRKRLDAKVTAALQPAAE